MSPKIQTLSFFFIVAMGVAPVEGIMDNTLRRHVRQELVRSVQPEVTGPLEATERFGTGLKQPVLENMLETKKGEHVKKLQLPNGTATALQNTTASSHEGHTEAAIFQVLCCVMVAIAMLTVGWMTFWGLSRNSDEEPKALKLALLCLSFSVCSWAMNITNKSLVESLHAPTLVTAAQMCMTVIGTVVLTRHKISGTRGEVMRWSFVPFLFFAMLVSSFFTISYISLSLLMIIRNATPLVVLPVEWAVMPVSKRPIVNLQMVLALCVIMGSTFLYCEKVTVSYIGVGFALLNMLFAVADRVAQRRLLTTECQGLSTETCVFLNNMIGLVPTLSLAMTLHEIDSFEKEKWFASSTTLLLLLSGVIGTGICYFAIAVQRELAAVSFMVLQSMVRVAVVLVGVGVFGDPIGWPYQVIGLMVNFAGALWYGKAQIDGAKKKAELS